VTPEWSAVGAVLLSIGAGYLLWKTVALLVSTAVRIGRRRAVMPRMREIEALLKDFDAYTEGYDLWHIRRYAATLALLEETFPKGALRTARILCVGEQGSGPLLLRKLLGAEQLVAVSIGEAVGEREFVSKRTGERQRLAIDDVNVERESWPYAADTFDLIVCFEMLEHLEHDPAFFALEAHRVLKPGGRVALTSPNSNAFRAIADIVKGRDPALFSVYGYGSISHVHEYSRQQLHALFTTTGFRVERYTTISAYSGFASEEFDALNFPLLWVLVTLYGVDPDSLANTHFIVAEKSGVPTMRRCHPIYGLEYTEKFDGYPVKPRLGRSERSGSSDHVDAASGAQLSAEPRAEADAG